MGIHLPGILKWGDISLAASLSNTEVTFIHPVIMSGHELSSDRLAPYQAEFSRLRKLCKTRGATSFQ